MSDPRSMSVKELKANIVSIVGESALAAKKFVEKSEFIEFLIQQQESVRTKKEGITIVPPGKYILGDPCFAVTDVLHLENFNETYYDSEEDEEEEGSRSKPKAKPTPVIREARFDEATVVTAFNTFSDGPTWFTEKKGKRSFLINAGAIVLAPLSYNPAFSVEDEVAHVVIFDSPASCFAKRGVIHFGDIEIDTRKPTNSRHTTRAAPKVRSGKRKASTVDEDSEIEEESGSEEFEEESFSGSISEDSGENWVPETPERKKRRKQQVVVSSSDEAEFDE